MTHFLSKEVMVQMVLKSTDQGHPEGMIQDITKPQDPPITIMRNIQHLVPSQEGTNQDNQALEVTEAMMNL